MKKYLKMSLAVLLVMSLLAGCGGSSMAADSAPAMKQEAAIEAPMAEAPMLNGSISDAGTGAGNSIADTEQKLIKTVRMDVETEDLENLLPQISGKISSLGGYVENQELYNGSAYSSYRHRSASLTVRIPAENLDGFVEDVKGVSNVVTYNESTENVTLRYVSTESRMKALEVEQERLLELLGKAENMADLLEIEARLTDVRYELENVTSQLRVLSNQVDYATIHLYISQVKVYTEVEEQTVWQRIGSGFKENLRSIGEDMTDFFVWLVTYSPQLILWAVVIAAAVVILKKKLAKKKVSRAPRQNDTQQQ
ncbi:MAG: DUF4349 domain-containing protein [Ruminococcaceae bacterium]|nr:DUF4349 domain-containing protein [Oscillospiraceae bacterium]